MKMCRSFSSLRCASIAHSASLIAYIVLEILMLMNQIQISHALPPASRSSSGPSAPLNLPPFPPAKPSSSGPLALSNLPPFPPISSLLNGPAAPPSLPNTKLPGNIAEMVYAVNLPNTKNTVLLNRKGEIVARFPSSMYGSNAMSSATSTANGPSFSMPKPDTALGSMPTNLPAIPSNAYQGFSSSSTSGTGSPYSQGSISGTPDLFSTYPSINSQISQKAPKLISDTLNILKSKPSPAALKKLKNILNVASKSKPNTGALNALQTALDFMAKVGGPQNYQPAPQGRSNTAGGFNTAGYAQNPVTFNEIPAKESRISAKGANPGFSFGEQTGNQAFNQGDPFGLQNMFASMPTSRSQTDLFGSIGVPFSNPGASMHAQVKKTPNPQSGVPPINHHHIHGVDMNTVLFGLLNKAKPTQGQMGTNVGPLGQGGSAGRPELFVVTGENSMQSPQFQAFMSRLAQAFQTGGSRSVDTGSGTGLHGTQLAKGPNKAAPGAPHKGGKKGSAPAPPVDPEAAAEAAAEAAEAAEALKSSADPPATKGKATKAGNPKGKKKSKKSAGKAAGNKASPVGGKTTGNEQQIQSTNEAQMSNTGGQNAAGSNTAGNHQQFQTVDGAQLPYTGGRNPGPGGRGQAPYLGSGLFAQGRPAGGKLDQTVSAEISGNQAAIARAEAAENIEAGVPAKPNVNQRKSSTSALQGSGAQEQYGPPSDFGAPPNYAPQAPWTGQSQSQGYPGPSAMMTWLRSQVGRDLFRL